MSNPQTCNDDSCFLCNYCLPGWKEAIAMERKVLLFEKGVPIFREGEPVRGIYFIQTGAVKISRSWGEGNQFILRWAGRGDVIGHRGHGSGVGFPVSATALTMTTVCFIETRFLEVLLKDNHGFLYQMMRLYADELQKAEDRMHDLALMPVRSRVAETLFAIREAYGTDENGFLRIPITRSDIAFHAGTTYEAVFRLLKEWSAEGAVSTEGKRIRIENEAHLRETKK